MQRPRPRDLSKVGAWMMPRRQQTNASRWNRQRRQKSWRSRRGSAAPRPCARRIRARPHDDHDRGRTGRSRQAHVQRRRAARIMLRNTAKQMQPNCQETVLMILRIALPAATVLVAVNSGHSSDSPPRGLAECPCSAQVARQAAHSSPPIPRHARGRSTAR